MTAAAGLEKWAWHECKSGCDQIFRALCWRAPPTVRNLGQIFHSVDQLGQAWLSVVRNWEISAIQVFLLYINHSEFSLYIKQCPLLGRGPLLGASVNGELTVAVLVEEEQSISETSSCWLIEVLSYCRRASVFCGQSFLE